MKKYLFLFVCIIFTSGIHAQNLRKGLVAHFPMDGNALDMSKYKNNGIAEGVIPAKDRLGNENSAYQFGGDALIKIPHSKSLNIKKAISIAIWIKMDRYKYGGMRIIDKNTAGGIDGYMFDTYNSYTNEGTGLRFGMTNFGANYFDRIPVNEWVHIAFVCGKGKFQYYINGELKKTSKAPLNYFGQNTLPLIIGMSQGQYARDEYFEGCMDNLRLYNRMLTEEEIKLIYNEQ